MKSNDPPPRQRQEHVGKDLLDDAVAPEVGDELCRRGDGEVPLQIHLPVLAAPLRQVQPGHARPAVGRDGRQRARRRVSKPSPGATCAVADSGFPGGVGSAESPAACSSGHWRPNCAASAVSSKESNKTLHPADTRRERWDSPSSLPAPCCALGSLLGHLTPAATPQRKTAFG